MRVEASTIQRVLDDASEAVEDGRGLGGTGFWDAVSIVKKDPSLVPEYGEQISQIDRRAFTNWALVTVPVVPGTVLMTLATLAGLGLVGYAYIAEDDVVQLVVFFLGVGALLVTTHGLAHLAVGRAVGIRFTHWFIGTVLRPQPGVKVEYASYLSTPAESRAWMHASGAIVTKLVPFAMIGAAVAAGLPAWVSWGLAGIGVASIITDVLWSTSKSDWKKFNRERRFAQES